MTFRTRECGIVDVHCISIVCSIAGREVNEQPTARLLSWKLLRREDHSCVPALLQ